MDFTLEEIDDMLRDDGPRDITPRKVDAIDIRELGLTRTLMKSTKKKKIFKVVGIQQFTDSQVVYFFPSKYDHFEEKMVNSFLARKSARFEIGKELVL